MSIAGSEQLVPRRGLGATLRALIAEARRRARRRRLLQLAAACAAVIAAVVFFGRDGLAGNTADTIVINTKWVETQTFAQEGGSVRIYVRRLEFTRTTWRAFVGLKSAASKPLYIRAHDNASPSLMIPVSFLAEPGVWWQQLDPSGGKWPLTYVARSTSIKPAYAEKLNPGKSWFGVFSGPIARLPKDRLLRIGFGVVAYYPQSYIQGMIVSTTHQFRVPRRR